MEFTLTLILSNGRTIALRVYVPSIGLDVNEFRGQRNVQLMVDQLLPV